MEKIADGQDRAVALNLRHGSFRGRCIRVGKRAAFVAIGVLCLAAGILGLLLPGLPATPFILLSSYFLARSWPRLNRLLLRTAIIGPILKDWQDHRAVQPHIKIQALTVALGSICLTLWLCDLAPVLRLIIVLLGLGGAAAILRVPSMKRERMACLLPPHTRQQPMANFAMDRVRIET